MNTRRGFFAMIAALFVGRKAAALPTLSTTWDPGCGSYTARYTHNQIAIAFAVTRRQMGDELYASLSERYTKALGRAAAWERETECASILRIDLDQ
jgi:hypothetical protein